MCVCCSLFVGPAKCAFTTEICPTGTNAQISKSKPCSYTFKTAGTFWISDKADDNCNKFGSSKKYIVT